MHCNLFVFRKKGEVIDENALLDSFNEATPTGADYVDPINPMKVDGKVLEAYRKSVTELKPAVEYLDRVKEGIRKAVDGFNPDVALDSRGVDNLYLLESFFYEIDDWRGDWFAISYGDGEFSFYRRADLAVKALARDEYYTNNYKDMELVPYDYHC